MTGPLYSLRGLEKRYQTDAMSVTALQGVDLDLLGGEFVVLLGPSGSGKTTLLNIIGGLDRPTSGRVCFRRTCLSSLGQAALTQYRRKHIGFIFQSYNLIPSLTARENVTLASLGIPAALDPVAALEQVGLRDYGDRFPAQLSGGEQQRVAVARAIAKRPDVLLCDEPTGALDQKSGVRVLAAIQEARRRFGALALVITHNRAIGAMADRVITLGDGAIQSVNTNAHPREATSIEW